MGRSPCCDKANVKRGPWSPEEDMVLKSYIGTHGTGGNWIALPQKAGLKRCGKSCRLRWLNYLRPDVKRGRFTDEEDTIICTLYKKLGSRWSAIASQLPGRTDNDVKNHWNTKLKKKLQTDQPHTIPTPSPLLPIEVRFGFMQGFMEPPDHLSSNNMNGCIMSTLPIDTSASSSSSSSINWLTNTPAGDDDMFLAELGFGSLTDLLGGYNSQDVSNWEQQELYQTLMESQ